MRRSASEIIRNLETRIARLEKQSLQVSRSTSSDLTHLVKREISRQLKCRLKDCHIEVLREGYDRELEITYLLVFGTNEKHESMYFVVADQEGRQADEDFSSSSREMERFFIALIN